MYLRPFTPSIENSGLLEQVGLIEKTTSRKDEGHANEVGITVNKQVRHLPRSGFRSPANNASIFDGQSNDDTAGAIPEQPAHAGVSDENKNEKASEPGKVDA